MAHTTEQLGAIGAVGFDPEQAEAGWQAVSRLTAEDKQTLMILLLAAIWRSTPEGPPLASRS